MGRKRTDKPVPAHLEYLPPIPDISGGVEKKMKALFSRLSTISERKKALMVHHKEAFEQTKNPLCAWDAYSRARRNQEPVPEWVLAYLDGVTERMLQAENKPEDLPEILGFRWKEQLRKGGRQAWVQYHDMVIRQEAVGHVLNFLRDEGPDASILSACAYAAEKIKETWGVTREWSAIETWYKTFKR